MRTDADVVVVGAGIIGLAAARALRLRHPGVRVVNLDKEDSIGSHQTGHNSGVIHSGVYYRPGSLKATLVASGRSELIRLCQEHGLPLDRCGKIIVATRESELPRLHDLSRRAEANGVRAELIDREAMRRIEPHVEGHRALHVPDAAIVDFGEVARHLAAELVAADCEVRLGSPVRAIERDGDQVVVSGEFGELRAQAAVNCAGLHSDVIARSSGLSPSTRIIAFRGEYHELRPASRHLVNHLVYPVPDPQFPFLGVHFTRMTDGAIHAGPNAVLALAREGYRWRAIDPAELAGLARSPALRALARRHWRTGSGEVVRSLSKAAMVRALRRLVPELTTRDLIRCGSGVRAQAVAPDGTLLDDFVIERDGPVVHVLNAPSPAATASLAIGRHIADLVPLPAR